MNRKTFDCVEFKNSIQKKLLKEYRGLKPNKAAQHFCQKLQTSRSPVANLWKLLQEKRVLKKTG